MRLSNWRTIAVLVFSIGVIIGIIVYSNVQEADAPALTPDASEAESGPLFPDVDQTTVTRFEIRELPQEPDEAATEEATEAPEADDEDPDATEEPTEEETLGFVVITKDDADVWTIEEASAPTERGTDQVTVVGSVGVFTSLQYTDRFRLDETQGDLDAFGLAQPASTMLVSGTDADGADFSAQLFVGNRNPSGQQVYTRIDDDEETIYLVSRTEVQNLSAYANEPPYVPAPTATPPPSPTPNPFSEVEQTQTAEAAFAEQFEDLATATPAGDVGPQLPDDEETDEAEVPLPDDEDADPGEGDEAEVPPPDDEDADPGEGDEADEPDVTDEATEEADATEEATEESEDE